MRVIDVEGEAIPSHHPVECWGYHTREWDLCRSDLSLELVLCSAFPGIHKGGQVVGKLIVGGEDGEDLGVGTVEELDGMGEVLRQNHLAKIANESNLRQVAVYRSGISLFG